jgi:hypothetical protein
MACAVILGEQRTHGGEGLREIRRLRSRPEGDVIAFVLKSDNENVADAMTAAVLIPTAAELAEQGSGQSAQHGGDSSGLVEILSE